MEDNRYMRHMNWDYDQCHKAYKCSHNGEDRWGHGNEKSCKKIEICWHKDGKHGHREDKCRCHEEVKCHCHKEVKCHCHEENKCCGHKENKCEQKFDNDCNNCICHLLKRFEPGTSVDVILSSGGSFTALIFVSLDQRNCCAYFLESGATSAPLIIDCKKIDAIRRNPS